MKTFDDKTILIVDDSEPFRIFLSAVIKTTIKSKVMEVSNPLEALDILKESTPSLIVLDMEMPYMDGYTFLQKIRAIPEYVDIPVIVCTVLSDTNLVVALKALNISGFIKKNSPKNIIIEKIIKVLEK